MILSDGVPQASLCTTDAVATLIEDLQYSLGEGPCIAAYRSGSVIVEPDLATPAALRWPIFTPQVVDAGARAIFGFPIRIGSVRIGALNLYRDQSGPLNDNQYADALVMADVIARTLLSVQAQVESGTVQSELDIDIHIVVHQAAGMVSSQLNISVGDALVRLRSFAFRVDRPLTEVAQDVIDRRILFDPNDER